MDVDRIQFVIANGWRLALPLVGTVVARQTIASMRHATVHTRFVLGALIFGIICAPLLRIPQWRQQKLRPKAAHVASVVVSVLIPVVAIVTTDGSMRPRFREVLTMLWLPSVAEELIFRVALPRSLVEVMLPGRQKEGAAFHALIAIVLAQMIFALSHLIPVGHLYPAGTWPEFFRLLTMGMVFASLVRVVGLGFTVGIHAGVNALAMFGTASFQGSVGNVVLVIGILLCTIAVEVNMCYKLQNHSPDRQHLPHQTHL